MSIVKLNNNGVKNATAFGSITGLGSMVFIKKLTASSSATLSFVDGASSVVLDNTYKEYVFTFNNIHCSGNNTDAHFLFNGSSDTGSNYNATKTSTHFNFYHGEDGADGEIGYRTNSDFAQSTDFVTLTVNGNNDNDGNMGGYLHLFNPSSTTFVKHFIAQTQYMHAQPATQGCHVAGYFNTTSVIDAIQFKMVTGTIDAGDICLYGIA
jgi:hypothetical protein